MVILVFLFVELVWVFKLYLMKDVLVVMIGILLLFVMLDNYGYMGLVKVVLEFVMWFLVKFFSVDSEVCFNVVGVGLFKMSVLVGIFGYIESYFYVEKFMF